VKKQKLSAASNPYQEAETKSNTELIDELIFMTSHSSVDDLDTDKVTAYLKTLDERAPIDEPLGGDQAEAWKRVLEKVDLVESLDEIDSEDSEPSAKAGRSHRIAKRVVTIAAAVVVLLSLATMALGINPIETVVKAVGDLIFFARNPSGELELPEGTNAEYRSLREALDANGMEDAMCPKWIPKGYALNRTIIKKTDHFVRVSAFYVSNQDELTVLVSNSEAEAYSRAVETSIEQNREFFYGNDTFYLSDNFGVQQLYARIGEYSYLIIGVYNEDEAQLIIQSLYMK